MCNLTPALGRLDVGPESFFIVESLDPLKTLVVVDMGPTRRSVLTSLLVSVSYFGLVSVQPTSI